MCVICFRYGASQLRQLHQHELAILVVHWNSISWSSRAIILSKLLGISSRADVVTNLITTQKKDRIQSLIAIHFFWVLKSIVECFDGLDVSFSG